MNAQNKGTPKTIDEAILNGLLDAGKHEAHTVQIEFIKTHVRDFMAQKAFHKDHAVAANYRSFYYKIFNLKEES